MLTHLFYLGHFFSIYNTQASSILNSSKKYFCCEVVLSFSGCVEWTVWVLCRREPHGCRQQTGEHGAGQDQAEMPALWSQRTSCKLRVNRTFPDFFGSVENNFEENVWVNIHTYTYKLRAEMMWCFLIVPSEPHRKGWLHVCKFICFSINLQTFNEG